MLCTRPWTPHHERSHLLAVVRIAAAALLAYALALFVSLAAIRLPFLTTADVYGLLYGALLGALTGADLGRGRTFAVGLPIAWVLSSLYFVRHDFHLVLYEDSLRAMVLAILSGAATGCARYLESKRRTPTAPPATRPCLERRLLAALWDAWA